MPEEKTKDKATSNTKDSPNKPDQSPPTTDSNKDNKDNKNNNKEEKPQSLITKLYNILFKTRILTKGGERKTIEPSNNVEGGENKKSNQEEGLEDEEYKRIKEKRRQNRRVVGIKGNPADSTPVEFIKSALLAEYNMMDLDPLISSVLDIYCEEILNKNEENKIIRIETSSGEVKSVLEDLFSNVIEVENNLYLWVRRLLKYGDLYLKLDYQSRMGIVSVKELPLENIQRVEQYSEDGILENCYFKYTPGSPILPYSTVNYYEASISNNYKEEIELEYEEVLHIRLMRDRTFYPYGTSLLESSRQTWKKLFLLEEAMLVHKLTKAPGRFVYKIDVTSIPEEEEQSYVESIVNELKRSPVVNETGNYNLRYNLNSILEDYFVISRGGQDLISIDTLKLDEMTITEELNYMVNRLLSGFKIPKSFYSYDERVEGKATLTIQDVRFAKSIERFQTIISYYLKDLAFRHLYIQGFSEEDLYSFDIKLNTSSRIYDSERIDLMRSKLELASDLISSELFSKRYAYKKVFGLTDAEVTEIMQEVEQDAKEEFRFRQIRTVGNDPKKTGKIYNDKNYGTDDIYSLSPRDVIRSLSEIKKRKEKRMKTKRQRQRTLKDEVNMKRRLLKKWRGIS